MTSIALWLIPFIISINMSYWRFIVFWTMFSFITGLVVRKALEKPLQGSTPRYVIYACHRHSTKISSVFVNFIYFLNFRIFIETNKTKISINNIFILNFLIMKIIIYFLYFNTIIYGFENNTSLVFHQLSCSTTTILHVCHTHHQGEQLYKIIYHVI